ncbi:MAG: phosphoribosylanthranilate isomerase [Planctomycetota bacterium]|nr:phosphoribosylanthranilate isomerase [Planctomycetota bacterium]MDA1213587.1 phosphoribosylanthranilate isomerase [Planctomycetota bacterium]
MMWIKICGIRDVETAQWVAAFEPAAIGLNFYAPSSRCVTPDVARTICETLPVTIDKVGVFVNHPIDEIIRLVTECGLTGVQLHGDELPEVFDTLRSALPTTKLIKAFRINVSHAQSIGESWRAVAGYLEACRAIGVNPFACLFDAYVSGAYGGTGKTIFDAAGTIDYDRFRSPPIILAGGLNPENVAAAIERVRPWGVDVASGVESSPGVKDHAKVERFITNARG